MVEPSIWSYQDNFDFRKDVDASSPFHHPLEHHRGEYSRQRMLTAFHLDPAGHVRPGAKPKPMEAVLFGGHIGCGKSTELRDYAVLFKNAYTVHHLELTKTLDINNLRFSDLLIALAQALVGTFSQAGLTLRPDPVFVDPVLQWLDTRIVKQERFKVADLQAAKGQRSVALRSLTDDVLPAFEQLGLVREADITRQRIAHLRREVG